MLEVKVCGVLHSGRRAIDGLDYVHKWQSITGTVSPLIGSFGASQEPLPKVFHPWPVRLASRPAPFGRRRPGESVVCVGLASRMFMAGFDTSGDQ